MRRCFMVAGALAGLLLLGTPAAMAATHKDVTVTGAGATFPLNMIEQWKADFNKSTGVTIAYTGCRFRAPAGPSSSPARSISPAPTWRPRQPRRSS